VIVGTFGSFNNRWTVWAAREGEAYELLADKENIRFGGSGPYNAIWLLTYTSDRIPGGRRVSSRENDITGVTIYTVGNGTDVGAGTLEFDTDTDRLRFTEFGGSAGAWVAASGVRAVKSGGSGSGINTGSYLIVESTPGSLPSGDQTDTITIASGRADTQVNYAELIISTSAIDAPGGFAPVLP
jgi:hypothetical protein